MGAGGDPWAEDEDGLTPVALSFDDDWISGTPRPQDISEAQRVSVAMGVPLEQTVKFDSLRFFGVKLEKKCAALGQKRVGKTCEDKEGKRFGQATEDVEEVTLGDDKEL